jgi:hypothetical protein
MDNWKASRQANGSHRTDEEEGEAMTDAMAVREIISAATKELKCDVIAAIERFAARTGFQPSDVIVAMEDATTLGGPPTYIAANVTVKIQP